MQDDPSEPKPKPTIDGRPDIDLIARRSKTWAQGVHALDFEAIDEATATPNDTAADLFTTIDPGYVGRELQDSKITMVGVQPGNTGILIATAKKDGDQVAAGDQQERHPAALH